MVVDDDHLDSMISAVDDGFGIEDMRCIVFHRNGDLTVSDVLFPECHDVRIQMLQHLKSGISIDAESPDGSRNGKAGHPRSRHGDAHAVFHQIGRH